MASPAARLRCLAKNLSHPCTFSLTPHTKVSILYPESNHFSTLSNESKPPTSLSYCYSSFIPYPLTNSTLSHGHSFFQHFKLISAWEHLRLPYRLARNVLFSELKRLSACSLISLSLSSNSPQGDLPCPSYLKRCLQPSLYLCFKILITPWMCVHMCIYPQDCLSFMRAVLFTFYSHSPRMILGSGRKLIFIQ